MPNPTSRLVYIKGYERAHVPLLTNVMSKPIQKIANIAIGSGRILNKYYTIQCIFYCINVTFYPTTAHMLENDLYRLNCNNPQKYPNDKTIASTNTTKAQLNNVVYRYK